MTPIVCVPKTDGSVCVCGDCKGTVNPAIQTEQFPIPTLEEIRGKVSTWEKFTKIELRSAYQQMVLDKASQQLCTINTHKGLFRYTRLPFGISSSPAIWQRFIEQVLAGLNGACVIMDDLLVGGVNEEISHATRVDPVLSRVLEIVKSGWPQDVEDLRLKPFLRPSLRVVNWTRLSIMGNTSGHPCSLPEGYIGIITRGSCSFGNRTDCVEM